MFLISQMYQIQIQEGHEINITASAYTFVFCPNMSFEFSNGFNHVAHPLMLSQNDHHIIT